LDTKKPLGIIGTGPRAYDIFRAYGGMEERKSKKNKEMKSRRM
jgi:hypothetical protein